MKKVDLIIPTHNRTIYLKRILDYYQVSGKGFNFIIADSSNPKNKAQNRKLIKQYSSLNILYIDKFSERVQQHTKFGEMVKYAKSKYCVFCADDDFVVPSGIDECVNFLEKNPDYSGAHGSYIGFYLHKNILGTYSFWWQFRYFHHSISAPYPIDRLTDHLKDFTLVLWAVRRTNVVKACYKEFLKTQIDPYLNIIFGEMLPDLLTVIYGKVKRLNTFYGARQYFGSIAYDFPSLIDAKNAGKYDTEYDKFKNCLLNNLPKYDNTSRDKASKIIDAAMERYIKYSYQEHLVNKVYFILRHSPELISNGVRLLHTKYLFSKEKKDPIGLIDKPSSKYYSDFNLIQSSVINHASLKK